MRIFLQAVIKRYDMQDIQVLAFVFMEALDLDIEQARRISLDAGLLQNLRGEHFAALPFDASPLVPEGSIINLGFEAAQCFEVARPAVPDGIADQLRQPGIRQHEKTPWRNAIRHIEELLRPHVVEVAEHLLLEKLAVKRGDPIDRVAADTSEVRHPD